jgi:hypothetical protein
MDGENGLLDTRKLMLAILRDNGMGQAFCHARQRPMRM